MASRRNGPRDVSVGQQQSQGLRGPRGGGGASVSGVGGGGMARVGNARVFPVATPGSWGLRALAGAFREESEQAQQAMHTAFRARAKEVENKQIAEGAAYGANTPLDQLALPAGDSIGDEAFRKSAILAAQTGAELSARDDIEKLADRFPGQPEAFKEALKDRAAAFVGDLDPAMQPEVISTFNRLGEQRYVKLDNDRREFDRDKYRATILQATDEHTTSAAQAARNGDWDGANAELAALANKVTAGGPVEAGGSGALSLVEIEKLSQDAGELIQGQFLEGWVERSPNPYKALTGLKTGKTGDAAVDGVLAVSPPRVTDHLAKELEGEIRAREVEARQAAAQAKAEARMRAAEGREQQRMRLGDLKDNVRDVAEALTSGVPVQGLGSLAKRIAAEGTAGAHLGEALSQAVQAHDYAVDFASMPVQDKLAELHGLTTTEHQLDDLPLAAAKVKIAGKVLQRDQESIAKGEQLLRANELGVVKLAPITDQASMDKRIDDARMSSAFMGTGSAGVTYLAPEEVAARVSGFKNAGTVDERLGMLAPLTVGLKDDEVGRKVLAQLEAKGLPMDARQALERLKDGDQDGARQILAGLGIDPKDRPKINPDESKMVEEEVDKAMLDPSNVAGLSTFQANLMREPAMARQSVADRNGIVRLAAERVAAGGDAKVAVADAIRTWHGDKQMVGSDDLHYVPVPSGADADAVAAGMAALRANVDLSHLAPVHAPPQPGQASTGAEVQAADFARRNHASWERDVRTGGTWTAVDGGYALMSPFGDFVSDPADPTKPKVWTLGELTSAGRGDEIPHGGSGNDRLAGVVDTSGAVMPGSNPLNSLMLLAQRALLNATAKPSASDPEAERALAEALGIPTKGAPPPPPADDAALTQ